MIRKSRLLTLLAITLTIGILSVPSIAQSGDSRRNNRAWERFVAAGFSITTPEQEKLNYTAWQQFMTSGYAKIAHTDYAGSDSSIGNLTSGLTADSFAPKADKSWGLFMTSGLSSPSAENEQLDYSAWERFMTSSHSAPNNLG